MLRLHPDIDAEALAAEFAERRRVRIMPFLDEQSADALREHVRTREDWQLILNAGERIYEIDRKGQSSLSEEQRRELDARVAAAAANGFQFRFESIRVADDEGARAASGTMLDAFALLLSSGEVRDLLRRITGAADIDFADAQATQFGPGDFLTVHDDAVEGKGRRAAYVMGLTPSWRTDWGGLLMFHGPDGDVEEAWLPRMNALSLFAVPQLHSVGVVAPFAPEQRLSVTGWLRSSPNGAVDPQAH